MINPGTVSLLGSTFSGTTISGIISSFAGDIFGSVIGDIIGSYILPGIGTIIGGLISLFMQPANPTVIVRNKLKGFYYDPEQYAFKSGDITSKGTGSNISGDAVRATTATVKQILEQQSRQWTDILNLFPAIVHDSMIPALESANTQLNKLFARLKFSEGGSRDIAQELKDFAEGSGPRRFYVATRPIIGAGIEASLQAAGLSEAAGLVSSNFGTADIGSRPGTQIDKGKYAGLVAPKKKEDLDNFIQALQSFIGLTGGLATVSSQGVTPFLSAQDLASLNSQMADVLKIKEGNQFSSAVENLQKQLKPILDFLQQSVQQTTDIFGRGLIAALDAASESQARFNFLKTLGDGTKDMLFKGITDAFIQSAQYNDLLAPAQQVIRQFTQQALETGQAPDIAAFRAALLPTIEQITTRGEVLAPLLAELQKLGADIKSSLGTLSGTSATNIVINIGSVNDEQDATTLAKKLADYLNGGIAP